MNSRGKKKRSEWDFFINPKTDKIQYNKKCLSCVYEDCKQSYRVKVVQCPFYEKAEKK